MRTTLVLVALVLVACGGRTAPFVEPPQDAGADAPDCSEAHCSILDVKDEVGCYVTPRECDFLYSTLCPPPDLGGPSFEMLCAKHHLVKP